MSLMIRLARAGTKKKPFFHVVVAEKRGPRDGRYLERLGTYNPKVKEELRLNINKESLDAWVKKGAQVSETVGQLVDRASHSK
jgi:small subunit ribosomal protein S16